MAAREWTELDYVAGAAHDVHMSYGRYVAAGMPNLERFKRRVASGEFDKKPVRRGRKSLLAAVAAKSDKRERVVDAPRRMPVYSIPEGKCQRCGAVIPAEVRSGVARKNCPECAKALKRERNRAYQKRFYDKQKQERQEREAEFCE